MSAGKDTNIVVLMGGPSSEADVSRATAAACAAALDTAGFTVSTLEAAPTLAQDLIALSPDVVFNAMHGHYGEDGCVQGVLEWLGLPYTHSGVLASALAMDKTRSKDVYARVGIPIVPSVLISVEDLVGGHPMTPPYVVKPNADGSSVGIYFVHGEGDRLPNDVASRGQLMMAEQYISGRELTVTVMGDRPLGVTEITTQGWYDYAAKYEAGGSQHVIPADIPQQIEDLAKSYAVLAHEALGCRGVSRSDFRWDETRGADGLFILETNTQPGMTATSLAPEQAQHCGISFGELCTWIVEDASCRR